MIGLDVKMRGDEFGRIVKEAVRSGMAKRGDSAKDAVRAAMRAEGERDAEARRRADKPPRS